jgi:hypothetical protein
LIVPRLSVSAARAFFGVNLLAALVVSSCRTSPGAPIQVSSSTAGAYEADLVALGPARSERSESKDGFVVAWYDTRDGNAEIYMRRLDERGRPAGPERRLTAGPEQSYEPSLVVLGEGVAAAWYDKAADGTLAAKVGAWRLDGTNRWVTTLAARARNPVAAQYGGELFCAWIAADETGAESVWSAWFDKDGRSSPPLRVGPAGKTTWNLNAVAGDFRTAVIAYDATAGTRADEIFLADVTPFGTRVTQLTDDDGVPSKYPDVSGTGTEAITWYDKRDGNDEIYLLVGTRTEIRMKATTARRVTRTPGESIGAYVSWAGSGGMADNDRVGLAWSDEVDRQLEIYFQPFARTGEPSGEPRRLTANSSSSLIPAIVPTADGFALAWNEYVAAADGRPASSQIAFIRVQ